MSQRIPGLATDITSSAGEFGSLFGDTDRAGGILTASLVNVAVAKMAPGRESAVILTPATIPSTNPPGDHEPERAVVLFSRKPDKATEWQTKLATEQEAVASGQSGQGSSDEKKDE